MTDDELKEKVKAILAEVGVWTGHREMTLEEVAVIQPGLGRIMPDIGQRTWKLYYAAKAKNWPLAKFEWKEIQELMELGAFTRPKHEEALNKFLAENWPEVGKAIDSQDFPTFEQAFKKTIEQANAYHELKEKPYIRWKLPDQPPPDLDLTPRESR